MKPRLWCTAAALSLACHGGGGEAPATAEGAAPPEAPSAAAAPGGPPPADPPTAAGGEMRELFTATFYRSPKGTAIARLPKLDEGWTVVPNQSGDLRVIQIFLGTPKAYQGNLT